MRPRARQRRELGRRIVVMATLSLTVSSCLDGGAFVGGDAAAGALGADTATHDTHTAAADTARPETTPTCADGARSCIAHVVEVCRGGAWEVFEVCEDGATCRDGQCVCAPACGDRACGPDGCGGLCGVCPGDAQCTSDGTCAASTGPFRALYIEGLASGLCNAKRAPGADIEAAELIRADGATIWLSDVIGEATTTPCPNVYTDPGAARGPVAGFRERTWVSLQGGWIAGRFSGGPELEPGMIVKVYDVDVYNDHEVELYHVYLATDFDCVAREDRYETCLQPLLLAAQGSIGVQLTGF